MARKIARYKDQLRVDKRRHFVRRVSFIICIVTVIIAGMIYLLFFARIFDVRAITVRSNVEASELKGPIEATVNEWLNNKRFFLQQRRNIIFLNTNQLQKKITENFPKIDSITISRSLRHELKINIKERSPQGIWCMSMIQRCFYFNKAGIIYEDAPQTSGFLILTIQDDRDRQVNLGGKITSDAWLQDITNSYSELTGKKIKIKSFVIPKDSIDEFDVLTSTDFKIFLSFNTDIDSQINAMVNFMNLKLTSDRISQLQYIDLRIQDRIYYK